ncbi:MAG: hypothetical protein H0X54_07150 [Propionibacteriales bacterium]|nr:hypothetical protein [Propionibacteriales bacterium]
MSRRVRVPGAEELFRPTQPETEPVPEPEEAPVEHPGRRASSGRVKHEEKMTVYISAEELMDLDHARLDLRRVLGAAVDRGRVVREAVAIALADLDDRGPDSDLVRRLSRS